MNELHTKYLNNTLSPDELIRLREKVNAASDKELEQQMLDSWLVAETPAGKIPDGSLVRIKKKVQTELQMETKRIPLWSRLLRIAVVLLIPVLMLTTFYFYQQSTIVASSDMVVKAGKGEQVSITLPDGTEVRINAESVLRYNPVSFNKKERRIEFEGEAFFEVSSNKRVPFMVSTPDMCLKVLGTKFNLLSRQYAAMTEVSLLEGHVLLSSVLSKQQQELFSNQKAFLQKTTGQFNVIKEIEKTSIAWLNGELMFKNKPLEEVVKAIETHFNVSFRFAGCDTIGRDLFTGTFPASDLNEALKILQKSYGFVYARSGREITVTCPSR